VADALTRAKRLLHETGKRTLSHGDGVFLV
jgi:hypothetical protein